MEGLILQNIIFCYFNAVLEFSHLFKCSNWFDFDVYNSKFACCAVLYFLHFICFPTVWFLLEIVKSNELSLVKRSMDKRQYRDSLLIDNWATLVAFKSLVIVCDNERRNRKFAQARYSRKESMNWNDACT